MDTLTWPFWLQRASDLPMSPGLAAWRFAKALRGPLSGSGLGPARLLCSLPSHPLQQGRIARCARAGRLRRALARGAGADGNQGMHVMHVP